MLKLPLLIIGRADVSRVQRELNQLDEFFIGAAARKSGESIKPPRITRLLDEISKDNKLNLLEAAARKVLHEQLEELLKTAPSLHISFAAEPSPKALETILIWFRNNVHAQALLDVGLQPAIGAGCVLRTPNKLFDMSLSSYLKDQEPYLAKLIDGAPA